MKISNPFNVTELYRLLGLWLLWSLGLWLLAMLAPQLLSFQPSFPYASELRDYGLPASITNLANFDGVHYLGLAERGYVGTGLVQAFFPLWPLLIGAGARLLDNTLLAGVLLGQILALTSLLSFYYLLRLHFSQTVAWRASLALLLFVSSFYLRAVYNEALFLTLLCGALAAGHRRHYWLAGALAALASATRIVGIGLWPTLLLLVWLQDRRQYLAYVQVSLAPLGLFAYMLYLQLQFGDPLYFLTVQSDFGASRQSSLVSLPQVIWRYLKILWTARPFDFKYFIYVQEFLLSLATGAALLAASWRTWRQRADSKHLRIFAPYLLFAVFAYLLPTLTGNFSSMPRYLLVCFVLFIYLGQLPQRWLFLYLTISGLLLIINLLLFTQGYWVA